LEGIKNVSFTEAQRSVLTGLISMLSEPLIGTAEAEPLCANMSETRNPSTITVWARKEISH
jgi:hypothetical protein